MSNDYGFGGSAKKPQADLTAIPKGPIEVDPALEGKAIRRAAEMGFVEREGSPSYGRRRRRAKEPTKSIYVRGPASIIDRFLAFVEDGDFPSYAAAINQLLEQKASS